MNYIFYQINNKTKETTEKFEFSVETSGHKNPYEYYTQIQKNEPEYWKEFNFLFGIKNE